MNKFLLTLMTMLFLAGCASSGGSASVADNNGGLPEIAPYDEAVYEALPDMVPNDGT